jgi:hypothetical protein
MGNTTDEVADYCRVYGITGEVRNREFCPVIKAIYRKFPNLSRGLVVDTVRYAPGYRDTGYGIFYFEGRSEVKITWNDHQTMDPDVPKAIQNFVIAFDNKLYPDLIGKSQNQIKQETLAQLTVEQKMALRI